MPQLTETQEAGQIARAGESFVNNLLNRGLEIYNNVTAAKVAKINANAAANAANQTGTAAPNPSAPSTYGLPAVSPSLLWLAGGVLAAVIIVRKFF